MGRAAGKTEGESVTAMGDTGGNADAVTTIAAGAFEDMEESDEGSSGVAT